MKKVVIVFIVAALVLLSTFVLLFFSADSTLWDTTDLFHFGIILMVVVFAVFIGYQRLKSVKRGEPVGDELSKKVLRRTSSLSYYISLYIWVFMLFIKDRIQMDTDQLIGSGILGMAVCFAVVWLFFHFRGIRDE